MDEFAGIRSWTENRQQKSWQQERGVVVGIGDDAAVVEATPGKGGTGSTSSWQSLITVDTMVETIHFNDLTMLEEDVGYKALAANISDIAAMGGIPRHAVISVSVPPSYSPQRVKQIYDGLYACANQYGVAIVGGDTTSSPSHLVLAVTLTGIIESGRSVYRSGAQPGDAVFVTGLLGMSAAGLDYLMKLPEKYGKVVPYRELAATAQKMADTEGAGALVRHHRRPQPSVAAGSCSSLKGHAMRSMMSVTDLQAKPGSWLNPLRFRLCLVSICFRAVPVSFITRSRPAKIRLTGCCTAERTMCLSAQCRRQIWSKPKRS